ncbi:hypothetical protein [Palleronia caenipelagi]|uniref:hypothetical protein n=1 Tax=Palleronia caenipelagi TaxID=2489174 RepID=UPI00163DD005|nr:hypothetical protein [Palleronia caenipelagi]
MKSLSVPIALGLIAGAVFAIWLETRDAGAWTLCLFGGMVLAVAIRGAVSALQRPRS